MVIQPGNECHLETVRVARGPQIYDWEFDASRFIRRSKRVPATERYPVLEIGADPEEWGHNDTAPIEWNKIGGVPIWLQGDDTPGSEWRFAFQFDADPAGGERGDGAVFYGFVSDDGRGALGWQCH
jgi:hypothetical protein